jgi:uncharacterized delta-60 repeat protein
MKTRSMQRRRPTLEALEGRSLLSGPGSLDTTFGIGGLATADFTAGSDGARSVAVQVDGKLIAAGSAASSASSFAAVRFNADGSLDTSYGNGGKVTTTFPGATDAKGGHLALQPDGKVVQAGLQERAVVSGKGKNQVTTYYDDFALVRRTADGALDPTFGSGGRVVTSFGTTVNGAAFAVAVQADGKIVAGGPSNASGQDSFMLVRYNADGSLDTGYGAGGMVTTRFATPAELMDMVIQGDGKVVAAGYTEPSPSSGLGQVMTVVRYNTDGSLDPTFGSGGVFSLPNPAGTSTQRNTRAVAIQPDGKIVVGALWSTYSQFDLVRLNTDGTLDTTFGTGGEVLTTFPAYNNSRIPNDVTVQSNGQIVVGGYYTAPVPGGLQPVVVRYNADGSLDTTFGNGGFASAAMYNVVSGVAVQPTTGRIIVAGRNNGNGGQFALTAFVGSGTTTLSSTSGTALALPSTWGLITVVPMVPQTGAAPVMGIVPPTLDALTPADGLFGPGPLSRKRPHVDL